MTTAIRVQIPFHLQTLGGVPAEVTVEVAGTPTPRSVVDALENKFPGLKGMVIDPHTGKRRPLVRFYVCQQDWTFEPSDKALPDAIVSGKDVFMILGAISGG